MPPPQPLVGVSIARMRDIDGAVVAQPERMFTVGEVAALYRFTPRTIRNWLKDGRIQVIRIGRSIRIPEASLRDFEANH